MITKIYKVNDIKKDKKYIEEAVKQLRNDELVAIPTETVYGLGANGLSEEACRKIFETKGRPQDNPLILHLSKIDELERLVKDIPEDVDRLMEELWPGPLTLIFYKSQVVPSIVTAGGSTVAIRIPNNNITRDIIEKAEFPIAAPSANLSGRPSPTTAEDVYGDLNGKIPLIIDGGQSNIGIESTVLDITEKPYTILRPGFFDKEDLEVYLDEVLYDTSLVKDDVIPRSPGQKYKHYAPKASVEVIVGDEISIKSYIEDFKKNKGKEKVAYILFDENKYLLKGEEIFLSLGSKKNLIEMAHNLFRNLRQADRLKVDKIICEGTDEKGIGIGIMNRLKKSSAGNIRRI